MKKLLLSLVFAALAAAAFGAGTSVNDAGTWRPLKGVYVNDAGTWRQIKSISVNDAGTWRQVYAGVNLQDSLNRTTGLSGTLTSQINVTNAGTVTGNGNVSAPSYTWLQSGSPSSYDVMATVTGGNTSPSGSATGTWLNLGTTRSWSVSVSSPSTLHNSIMTVQIRDASSLSVLASATFTMEAERID
jgi:hypothetical protein